MSESAARRLSGPNHGAPVQLGVTTTAAAAGVASSFSMTSAIRSTLVGLGVGLRLG